MLPVYYVVVQYPCMTIKLYSILVYNLLFTQDPIPVCLDGTIIDSSSTILVTMYYLLWLCCGMIGGCAW